MTNKDEIKQKQDRQYKQYLREKRLVPTSEIGGLDELLNDPRIKSKVNLDKYIQTQWEPKTKRHFILVIDGIDSWMVSHINEMPEFKKCWFSKELLKCDGDFKVTLYSPIAPSSIQQLKELLLENKKVDIILKQLDPVGTVIAQQTFKKCKLSGFRISNYSYDSNDLEKVLATFKCKNVSIDF